MLRVGKVPETKAPAYCLREMLFLKLLRIVKLVKNMHLLVFLGHIHEVGQIIGPIEVLALPSGVAAGIKGQLLGGFFFFLLGHLFISQKRLS